jgi:ribose transport system substrate-binding protein
MSYFSSIRGLRGRLIACAMAASVVMLSGCGSSSNADAGSSDGGGADTAAAKALVSKYSAPMTSLGLSALQKKPAPGKKIVVVVNNIPESGYIKDGAVAAARVLGWTVTPIVYDAASPTGLTAAFAQAVEEAPDGVITNATNATDYAEAAKALADKNIPVVTSNTTDTIASPIIANVADPGAYELAGRIVAAYAVAQQGDKASVAMFNIPSFPILKIYETAFKKEFHSLCPNCHYESHPVQAGDIGTKVPAQVVSAVQRTPSINFAAMGFGAVGTGVSAALASAGLKDTKIIGIQPSTQNLEALTTGTEDMWVASPITGMGWKSVDAFARYFNHEPVDVATTTQLPFVIITKENAEQNKPRAEVNNGDYEDIFKKLWLVG